MDRNVFLVNKYTNWYNAIINRALTRECPTGYVEKHHILPKSLGGSNDISNLVTLTAKEHFIVHHLLVKMTLSKVDTDKMWSAFFMMHIGRNSKSRTYAKTYELSKRHMSESKKMNYLGENNHFYGKNHTEDTKEKMSSNWNRISKRNHDTTLYTFVHKEFGIHYCTRFDLCKNFNLNHKRVWTIVNKTQKTTGGWSITWENEATS